jgi:cytochrome c biogenesis protein CcmG/thiol:disulfide interchange protein DsbE
MTATANRPPAEPPDHPERRRRSHTVLYIAVAFAAVVALLVVVLATRKPAADRGVYSALLNKPAPAVVGKTIDGKQFDLAQHRGKWVVVNFFASWCTPCAKEHPELQAWAREHADAGDGDLVAVVYGDTAANARAFFARNGGDWPVVMDEGKESIAVDYGVTAPPESYLIAPDGTVVTKIVGGVRAHDLDEIMAKAEGRSTTASTTLPTSS